MLAILALAAAIQTTPPRPWDEQDQAVVQTMISQCMTWRLDPSRRPTLPASWTDMGNGYGKLDRPDGSSYHAEIPAISDRCQLAIVNGDLAATRAFVAGISVPGLNLSVDRDWFHWDRQPDVAAASVEVKQLGPTIQIQVRNGIVRGDWAPQDQEALAQVLDWCTGFILGPPTNFRAAGWVRDESDDEFVVYRKATSGRSYEVKVLNRGVGNDFSCSFIMPWTDSENLRSQMEALSPAGLVRRADGDGWAWYRSDAAPGAEPVFRIAISGLFIEPPLRVIWISGRR